ncbi:MAG: ROK family protein [Solobacterium sp.]|nr:ROK family protein [Solobacterium sp.]
MNASELYKEYEAWILTQTSDEYEIRKTARGIDLVSPYGTASMSYTELDTFNAVELEVVNQKNGQITFYLHFDLQDLERAKELFREMVSVLLKMKYAQKVRVLLCCTSAITTSYFTNRLNEVVDILKVEMEFHAVSYNDLFKKGYDNDVILLAPQVSYLTDMVGEIFRDKVVLSIPPAIFGAYDVNKLIRFVEKGIAAKEEEMQEELPPAQRLHFEDTGKILIICVIVEYVTKRIMYRLYDKGEVILEDQIIKEKYELRDLMDVLDVTLKKNPETEQICICTPGIIYDGYLTFRSSGIIDVNVDELFRERYGREILFINDANAMVLGWYGMQKEHENICFYFHPHAARTSGTGNIVNGQLIRGFGGTAGEMQYMHKIIGYSRDPQELMLTPEGTLEVVTKYLLSIICTFDPEQIVIYCDMVPDPGELKKSLTQYILEKYIPELVKVSSVYEYMFTGGMMECIEHRMEEKDHDQ